MRSFKFSIDIYEWDIQLVQLENGDETSNIPEDIFENLTEEVQEGIEEWIVSESLNAGYTDMNVKNKTIYVILSVQSSMRKAANAYYHEARHVVDNIVQYCGIADEEAPAYLQGYIGEYFNDFMYNLNANNIKR